MAFVHKVNSQGTTAGRRCYISILVGLITTILLGIVLSAALIASRYYLTGITESVITTAIRAISTICPLLVGTLIGYLSREKGWLYGGLTSVVILILSLALVSLSFLLPAGDLTREVSNKLATKNVLSQLINAPVTIIIMAIGGLVGELLYRKKSIR